MQSPPDAHRLVIISDSEGREFRSRIEDDFGPVLVLARPLDLPVEHEFAVGEPMTVSWADHTGLISATTELIETRIQGQIGLWVVRIVGGYTRLQRRQFVRVPAAGAIQLYLPLPAVEKQLEPAVEKQLEPVGVRPGASVGARAPLTRKPHNARSQSGKHRDPDQELIDTEEERVPVAVGHLLDISEAALRCAVKLSDAESFPSSTAAEVGFTLGEQQFHVPAVVGRIAVSRKEPTLMELVFLFRVRDEQARRLRRLVFAEQLRIRNG